MRIHEPRFEPGAALFIIWCESPEGMRYSIAAGIFAAAVGAWDAVQSEHPRDVLTLQQGARIIRHRGPIAR